MPRVDPLVVETEQSRYTLGLWDRRLVAPHEVVVHLAVDLDVPVRRLALERARGLGVRGAEHIGADVFAGEVIAGREARLLQEHGPVGFGDLGAVDGDLDVQVGGRDGDGVALGHV
jgi:hypothetical protein